MTDCFDGNRYKAAANNSGKAGEQAAECIAGMLRPMGYSVSRQYSVCNIRADLFIRGVKEYPRGLIISIKTQFSKGTAEQKLTQEVTNLHKTGYPSIVLLIGNGWTKSLVDSIDADRAWHHKNVKAIFRSLDDFLQWSKDLPQIASNGHELAGFDDSVQMSLFTLPIDTVT